MFIKKTTIIYSRNLIYRKGIKIKEKGIKKVLIDEEKLNKKVKELARKISKDYQNKDLVIISVLKGALYFVADLTRQISIPLNIDFLAIGRYPGQKDNTGVVRITKDLDISINNRHVLMVEDIIDTGLTVGYLLRNLEPRRPASINICTLLDNQTRRLVELPIRYRGFKIPDTYVVGYGLDYNENYRHLPYIAELNNNQQ